MRCHAGRSNFGVQSDITVREDCQRGPGWKVSDLRIVVFDKMCGIRVAKAVVLRMSQLGRRWPSIASRVHEPGFSQQPLTVLFTILVDASGQRASMTRLLTSRQFRQAGSSNKQARI